MTRRLTYSCLQRFIAQRHHLRWAATRIVTRRHGSEPLLRQAWRVHVLHHGIPCAQVHLHTIVQFPAIPRLRHVLEVNRVVCACPIVWLQVG